MIPRLDDAPLREALLTLLEVLTAPASEEHAALDPWMDQLLTISAIRADQALSQRDPVKLLHLAEAVLLSLADVTLLSNPDRLGATLRLSMELGAYKGQLRLLPNFGRPAWLAELKAGRITSVPMWVLELIRDHRVQTHAPLAAACRYVGHLLQDVY